MIFNLNSFTQKDGGENNLIVLIAILFIIIFFFIIMPDIEKTNNNERSEIIETIENVMPIKIDTKKCSRSCCINSGWPLPKELQSNDISPDELKNYIPNNFTCSLGSNGSGSGGCVCVSKDDYDVLGSRVNNGISGCDN
jgi:hypothetical protein